MAETSWQMLQPTADYQAGLYPNWSDCERWRDGTPADPFTWSYGTSVVDLTTTVVATTELSTTTTSTTEPASTTTQTTTTTTPTTTTTEPTPQTTSPQPTQPPPPPPTPVETTTPETTIPETTTTTPSTTTLSTTTIPETTVPATTTSSTSTPDITTSTHPTPTTIIELADDTPSVDATEEEKQAFEQQTNLFDGTHDDYVPLGSTITVAQRRTIVAATTILVMLPTPSSRIRRR
jgi:hypothetical protein